MSNHNSVTEGTHNPKQKRKLTSKNEPQGYRKVQKLVQSNIYFSEGRILTCEVNRDKIQWLRCTVEIRRMTEDLRSR